MWGIWVFAALAANPCAGLRRSEDPFLGLEYRLDVRRDGVIVLVIHPDRLSMWVRVKFRGQRPATVPAGTPVSVKTTDGEVTRLPTTQDAAPVVRANPLASTSTWPIEPFDTSLNLRLELPPEWASEGKTPQAVRAALSSGTFTWEATAGQRRRWGRAMVCAASLS